MSHDEARVLLQRLAHYYLCELAIDEDEFRQRGGDRLSIAIQDLTREIVEYSAIDGCNK